CLSRRGSRVRVPSVPPLIESPEHLLRAFFSSALLLLLEQQKSSAFHDLFLHNDSSDNLPHLITK
ncbi:hypothetical protein, partial [uncultured Leclercia sp.]|uniref:hypothetical protein n=1 Tax=uncultured Leclercia sp. TaxID=332959 RepID=UPI002595D8BA